MLSCFNLSELGRFILWQAVRPLSLSEIYAQPLANHLGTFGLLQCKINKTNETLGLVKLMINAHSEISEPSIPNENVETNKVL